MEDAFFDLYLFISGVAMVTKKTWWIHVNEEEVIVCICVIDGLCLKVFWCGQVLCDDVTKSDIDAVLSDLLHLYDMEAKCVWRAEETSQHPGRSSASCHQGAPVPFDTVPVWELFIIFIRCFRNMSALLGTIQWKLFPTSTLMNNKCHNKLPLTPRTLEKSWWVRHLLRRFRSSMALVHGVRTLIFWVGWSKSPPARVRPRGHAGDARVQPKHDVGTVDGRPPPASTRSTRMKISSADPTRVATPPTVRKKEKICIYRWIRWRYL